MSNALVIYAALSLMVAYLGHRSRLGFIRTLLLCFLLTPFVMLVYLLLFASIGHEAKPENHELRDL